MNKLTNIGDDKIRTALERVMDPEIPVLSVVEMGIVRKVEVTDSIVVTITPTYSGCPAMNTIAKDIKSGLMDQGYHNIEVVETLSPPWTTDWLTTNAKNKLKRYGIAPPQGGSTSKQRLFLEDEKIKCPRCKSSDTQMISEFGSTPCKAHYQCNVCLEPFDYFKCI